MFGTILSFSVLVKLAESENRSFKEEFGDDTANAENVHCPIDLSISGFFACFQKSFGGKIAGASTRGIKIERKICGVIFWEECRLEG